jgi:hypothetical protein
MIVSRMDESGQDQERLSRNMKTRYDRRFAGFPVTFLSTGSAKLGKKAADRSLAGLTLRDFVT